MKNGIGRNRCIRRKSPSVLAISCSCVFSFGLCGCAGLAGYSNESLFPKNIESVRLEMFDNLSVDFRFRALFLSLNFSILYPIYIIIYEMFQLRNLGRCQPLKLHMMLPHFYRSTEKIVGNFKIRNVFKRQTFKVKTPFSQ